MEKGQLSRTPDAPTPSCRASKRGGKRLIWRQNAQTGHAPVGVTGARSGSARLPNSNRFSRLHLPFVRFSLCVVFLDILTAAESETCNNPLLMAAGTLSLLPLMMYRRVLGDTPRAIYRAVCALVLRFHQRRECRGADYSVRERERERRRDPPLAGSISLGMPPRPAHR